MPGKRDLTMNKTKMAWASAALALALLLPAAGVKAYSSENVSLPSPIVEYASYNKLREAVGFEPLFLPRIAGYKTEHFLFIGEGLAGKWKDIEIGSTVVSVAKLSDKSFAAHWIEGGYAFSFMGENMKEKDFESLLSGYFIDVTEHVFGTDDASSIHHDMPF